VAVTWSSIAVGTGTYWAYACGLTADGRAYCWGDNGSGQLGTGTRESSLRSVPVSGTQRLISRSAGWKSAGALTAAGEAWCWGELVGNSQSVAVPTRVPGSLTFRLLSHGPASGAGICALTNDGTAWCWSTRRLQPVLAPGGLRFPMLSMGDTRLLPGEGVGSAGACGLTRDGAINCHNEGGARRWRRVSADSTFVSLAQGPSTGHACASTALGRAHWWGQNMSGPLGAGDRLQRATPIPVAGGQTVSTVAVGGETSGGITSNGEAYCRGVNTHGQLGNGTKSSYADPAERIGVTVPTRVLNRLR